jgi:hypothetical protein
LVAWFSLSANCDVALDREQISKYVSLPANSWTAVAAAVLVRLSGLTRCLRFVFLPCLLAQPICVASLVLDF